MVTVASLWLSSKATGMPTILERPTTTARLPAMATPHLSSSSIQPKGVQGTKRGCRPFMVSWPTFSGWNPSTSFSRLTALSTACSSICLGSGSCTRMPCTSGLSLKRRTTSNTSSCVAVSGKSAPKLMMPTSSQAFFFMRTYVWLSLRSPTHTTASPGTRLYLLLNSATPAAISARIRAATAFPSITGPVMRGASASTMASLPL
mmetsp:Transcript_979/g.1545  ORF Transcript_979/g.1545 Transcript_979/m.1545 type:complete len:204 (+) Transcript_979:926-1537(+)